MEITHSLTAPEIDALVDQMMPHVPEITEYTLTHRARLVKPMISFDAQALALSFLPAAGEAGRSLEEDKYSYHQLRRDLYAKAEKCVFIGYAQDHKAYKHYNPQTRKVLISCDLVFDELASLHKRM